MSLRTRLLAVLLAAALAGLLIVDLLTYTLVTRSQIEQVDQELERAHPPIERAAAATTGDREQAIREAAPGFYVELRTPKARWCSPCRSSARARTRRRSVVPRCPCQTADDDDDAAVFVSIPSGGEHSLRVRVSRQSDEQHPRDRTVAGTRSRTRAIGC